MEPIKPEDGTDKQNAERILPRGLEHVSHLFLSRPQTGRTAQDNSHSASGEPSITRPVDPTTTVVLRPCGFSAREQVASLLRRQTASLEEGMRAIDVNVPCETSESIEVLALDARNQLAIIDFDDHSNDALLLRGIDHVNWITRNMHIVRRMYQGQAINFALQPRIVLVAPDFSPLFRSVVARTTSLPINCVKYHAIAIAGGIGIFFEEVLRNPVQSL